MIADEFPECRRLLIDIDVLLGLLSKRCLVIVDRRGIVVVIGIPVGTADSA